MNSHFKQKETIGLNRPVGRPPFFINPDDLQKKIDEYFETGCHKRKVIVGRGENKVVIDMPILTISGLVRYCGFASRQSFYDLEDKQEFAYTIKRARSRIAEEYEELLQQGLGAGAIFALKNFGWKDEQYIKGNGFGDTTIHIHPQRTVIFKDIGPDELTNGRTSISDALESAEGISSPGTL